MAGRHPRTAPWIAPDLGRGPTGPRAMPIDVAARIAARQAGAVARRQLLAAGLTPGQIRWLVDRRVLIAVRRGVYVVGQRALSPLARYWVDVLACGPTALLGGWSAAAYAGAVDHRPRRPTTVAVSPDVHVAPRGVRVRRLQILPRERSVVDGMAVMTVPRAILEVAATDGTLDAERVWRGAVHRGLLDIRAATSVVEAHDGEPGIAVVRGLLVRRLDLLGAADTALEEHIAALVARAGLPAPVRNLRVVLSSGRVCVFDLAYPRLRLAVEADGPHHDDPEVRAEDAARDADAARDGWDTVRAHHLESDATIVARFRGLAPRFPC